MPHQVSMGAMLECTFGSAPSALVVLPVNQVMAEGPPAANIMDHIPMQNILSFTMCKAPLNPVVISATALSGGVPTPAPCVPVTPAPWAPGAVSVMIGGKPALDNVSKCACAWAGVIGVSNAGTVHTMIP